MRRINNILIIFIVVLCLFLSSCKKETITLTNDSITLKVGETYLIEPSTNVANPEYIFNIADNSIINIENNTITALKKGSTEVRISIKDSKAEEVTLYVNVEKLPNPVKITTETSLELIIGTTYQLEYKVEPLDASQEVTFSSADKSVIEIDENGLVKCIDLGETFITIKSKVNNVKV